MRAVAGGRISGHVGKVHDIFDLILGKVTTTLGLEVFPVTALAGFPAAQLSREFRSRRQNVLPSVALRRSAEHGEKMSCLARKLNGPNNRA
jgi:hypothetical protein